MTDPKEKSIPVVPTRTPKKKTPGIFDNLRKIPQPHPVEEMLGLIAPENSPRPSTPSRGSTPSTPSRPSTPAAPSSSPPAASSSISPERDFTKVPNSIVRAAIPGGIFGENGGKSKQLYDYLYMQTRGAIVPRRKIRLSKEKLMKGAGIGSEVTLRKNLSRLREAGLVKDEIVRGAHGGNEYEVLTPEEVGLTGYTPSRPSRPSRGSNTLSKIEGLDPLEDRGSRGGLSPVESTEYSEDKTFLKDLRTIDDDEAFAELFALLKQAAKEVTGRSPQAGEKERWRELGELLVTELRIAGARTTISSVPAFLTEHLRRRLWKKDKQQLSEEGKGETASEVSEAKEGGPALDARTCPDCGGSGMYYPDGYEKGVAKCRHKRLAEGKTEGKTEGK